MKHQESTIIMLQRKVRDKQRYALHLRLFGKPNSLLTNSINNLIIRRIIHELIHLLMEDRNRKLGRYPAAYTAASGERAPQGRKALSNPPHRGAIFKRR